MLTARQSHKLTHHLTVDAFILVHAPTAWVDFASTCRRDLLLYTAADATATRLCGRCVNLEGGSG
eukprot:26463-Eustigmatos_ZCMA.PRE.1